MATTSRDNAKAPLILTFDIGSSSIRTLLYDRLGRLVEGSLAAREHRFHTSPPGASEADPDALLEILFACLDETLAKTTDLAGQIRGVASCVFVSNVCGVDAAGQVVLPLTTYADTRAVGEVAGLQADLDETATYQRTGCRFHPSYLPARLRWLARTEPEKFPRVARWLSLSDYLTLKLFGRPTISYSVASWSGLLNRHTLTWDEIVLAQLPLEIGQLSPLTDLDQPQQGLRPDFAARWPALRNIPWFPTIGDGVGANIGSGCASAARVALTIGTTSAMRAVIGPQVPGVPDGLWAYRVDKRRSLLGGALSEGGNLFDWLQSTVRLADLSQLDAQVAALEPDGHGLTMLPFLTGERSPGWAGQARATIHGLTLATTPLQILQAGLEAVAYRLAQVYRRLRPALQEEPEIIVSGGALRQGTAWAQIIADVLGRPLFISDIPEASSRGAALLALEMLGICPDLSQLPAFLTDRYDPQPERFERYQQAIARQQTLYEKLISN